MAARYNSGTSADVKTCFDSILSALSTLSQARGGAALAQMDWSLTPGFSITITVDPNGRGTTVTGKPSDQGVNDPFGPDDGQPTARATRQVIKIP